MILEMVLASSIFVGAAERDEAMALDDIYLCGVYDRLAVRQDGAGDFTWKDPVAAARRNMSVCQYVVEGMHPKLRHALAALGREADAREIPWSILSGFRDDYRQGIASGFKAADCSSLHGGSCRTNGYGDGRAADLWTTVGQPDALFKLVDTFGSKLGLYRPMQGSDPAHIQIDVGGPVPVARVGRKVVSTIKVHYDEDEDEPRRKRRPASRDYDDDDRSKKRKRRLAKNEDD
jgi:hypothetical protein